MTVTARLSAYLFADTAEFESGMKRASKALLSFGNVTSAVLQGAAVVGAFHAATDAIKALTIEQFKAIDAQSKMARTLGVSVAAFNAMSRVASEAGIDQESFTKALTNTQKALFDAA